LFKYIVTTSRRPTRRLRSFANEFSHLIPNAIRLNRGKASLRKLAVYAVSMSVDKVIVIEAVKGNPSRIVFYDVDLKDMSLVKRMSIALGGVRLIRESKEGVKVPQPSSLCLRPLSTDDNLIAFSEKLSWVSGWRVVFSEEDEMKFDVSFRLNVTNVDMVMEAYVPRLQRPIGLLIRVKGYRVW